LSTDWRSTGAVHKIRGVHFQTLDLGIDARTPTGKMIIGVYSIYEL
jgi:DNA invertase Pin-like site-specific DNA recombinase